MTPALVILGALATATAIVPGPPARAEGGGPQVGLEVILKPGVAPPGPGARGPAASYLRYRVEQAEGERLRISSGGVSGWVRATDVVPFAEAIRYFTKAIRDDPRAAWAYARRALVWYDKREFDIAVADLSEAIQLDPKDPLTRDNRGLARLELKDWDRAIADFDAAIALDRRDPAPFVHRGLARLAKGDAKTAASDFGEAIRLDPKGPAAYIHRGLALARLRRFDLAIADYRAAIRLAPDDPWAANGLAWLLATCPVAAHRDGAQAVALATRAKDLSGGKAPLILGTLAAAEAEAGHFDEAVRWQSKALELFPAADPDLGAHRDRLALYRSKTPYREGPAEP